MVEAIQTKTKCTPRCWRAKSKKCRCSYGGENHGCERQPNMFTGTTPPNMEAVAPKYRKQFETAKAPEGGSWAFIEGNGGTREVFFTDEKGGISEITPHKSWKLVNHSPDGFNWGYGGSGAAQLALGILLELMDDERAQQNYQQFKWDIIATLPQGQDFKLPMESVRAWIEAHTEIRYGTR